MIFTFIISSALYIYHRITDKSFARSSVFFARYLFLYFISLTTNSKGWFFRVSWVRNCVMTCVLSLSVRTRKFEANNFRAQIRVALAHVHKCSSMGYIHTLHNTYIHIHTYTHTHIHTYLPTYLPTYIHTYIHTHTHTHTHTYTHTYVQAVYGVSAIRLLGT